MNNRLYNCKNPYQGESKRVLCVCSAGLLRSPTAANVLHRAFGYNTRAAGIDQGHALVPLDDVLLHWADEIVCMDERQKMSIEGMLPDDSNKTIKVLNIADSYEYMDIKLQENILESYKEHGMV